MPALIEQSLTFLTEQDDSVSGRLRQSLSSVITIRKVGTEQEGSDVESRLARLEALAQQGNLQAALSELDAIEDTAIRKSFAHWQNHTRFVLSLSERLNALRAIVHHAAFSPHDITATTHAP